MAIEVNKIISDLRLHEGFRGRPYLCTAGKTTIGIGRNLDANPLTEAEAKYLLFNDIERVLRELDQQIPWWQDLHAGAQRSLVNMVFQLGIGGVLKFKKMLKALSKGDYEAAATHALDSQWAKHDTPVRAKEVAGWMLG